MTTTLLTYPLAMLAALLAASECDASAIAIGSAPADQCRHDRGTETARHRCADAKPSIFVIRSTRQNAKGNKNAGQADEQLMQLPLLGWQRRGDVKSLVTILLTMIGSLFAVFSIFNADRTYKQARLQACGRTVIARGRVRRDGSAAVCAVDLVIKNVGAMHLSDLVVTACNLDGRAYGVFRPTALEELGSGDFAVVRLAAEHPLPWAAPIAGPLLVDIAAKDHLGRAFVQRRTLRAAVRNGGERLLPALQRQL
jgi:hypothetical protein